jgi:hypothetical protein
MRHLTRRRHWGQRAGPDALKAPRLWSDRSPNFGERFGVTPPRVTRLLPMTSLELGDSVQDDPHAVLATPLVGRSRVRITTVEI